MSIDHRISLSALFETEKGPIWLINTSGEKYPSGAEVFITINSGDQSSVFVVPRTWLPIEITNRFPRKVVMESSYFVSAVAEGLVSVISADYARSLLSGPKAEREQERLKDIEAAIKEASAARGIGKNVLISTGDPEQDAALAEKQVGEKSENFVKKSSSVEGVNFADEEDEEAVDPVSANFKAWVIKLNGLAEDTASIENELRMRGQMSLEEAVYLLKNCENEDIQNKLKRKLKKLGENV